MSNFHLKRAPDTAWPSQRAMCGTRDAAAAWERDHTRTLKNSWVRVWCEQGSAFRCEKMDAYMVVHGDDFVTLGDDDALGEVEHVMSSHYTIKSSGDLGAGRDDAEEMRVLNRYVRWNSDSERE